MPSEKKQTVFERLSSINVNEKAEKKDNLTYLSWAWAWSETKKACPDATYKILPTDFDEELGFMCHTTVTIEGETLEMWLPVMDGKNKSMKKSAYKYATKYGEKTVEAATTFDINKTMMRCLVKNLAMFGLGIYIYAGEDIPEIEAQHKEESKKQTSPAAAATSPQKSDKVVLKKDSEDWVKVVNYVTQNKGMGIEAIGKQLVRKYEISPSIKKEIAELCRA